MHIPKGSIFFPSKKDGGSTKRGNEPDLTLTKALMQLFLTLASSKGGILYYLLAGGTNSGSKLISCLIALSGGVIGG